MAQKRFLKGLFKDTAHIDQPESTWRHARNAILNQTKGAVSNEGGTQEAGSVDSRSGIKTIIGVIEIENDQAILFVRNDFANCSEIYLWAQDISTLIYTDELLLLSNAQPFKGLEFNVSSPIEGTFNISPKGDIIVYWTDDNNPPRALNVTLQQASSSTEQIYSIDFNNSHKNHISLLNLFPHAGPVPHVRVLQNLGPSGFQGIGFDRTQLSTKEGGGLLTGVYYLSLAYVDESYTATNFLTMSNPVSIIEEGDHTKPNTKKDGAKSGTQTSKSITWDVTNLNADYKFIRPVIIRKMGAAVDAYRLNDVEIVNNIFISSSGNINTMPHRPGMSITFSGIEGFTPTSLEDVIIDTVSYDTAKTLNQLDGVLYVGNTTGVQDLGYQKYANNIKLDAVTRTFGAATPNPTYFDPVIMSVDNLETGFSTKPVDSFGGLEPENVGHEASYRYTPNIYEKKGYMRDEVYAFYIAFILNDGSMSYAYHIPGRAATGDDKLELPDETWFRSFKKLSPDFIKRFHLHDYSDLSGNRNMNYWENATETYPNTENFEVWDGVSQSGTIQGTPVRHHHFPSNGNPTHKTIHENKSELAVSEGTSLGTAKNWASVECGGGDVTDNNCHTVSLGGFTASQTFRVIHNQSQISGYGGFLVDCNEGWKTMQYPEASISSSPQRVLPAGVPGEWTGLEMFNTLWSANKYFTADQPMEVTGAASTTITNYTDSSDVFWGAVQIILERAGSGGAIEIMGSKTYCTNGSDPDCSDTGSQLCEVQWTNSFTIDAGDRIYTRINTTSYSPNGHCGKKVRYHNGAGSYQDHWFSLAVTCGQGILGPNDLKDVKLQHNVKALGFELSDVKIPTSIASKVQGFRIFRAKRKHEDKRILGQSIITPMLEQNTTMGKCEETIGNPDASQILSAALTLKELIYTKDPWALEYYNYPTVPLTYNYWYNGTIHIENNRIDPNVFKQFSFNDFNLLRTQNSIAGATHIKPEYFVQNLVWNGPTMNQDKKMMSKIIEDDGNNAYSEPIKKIEQFWGHDKDFNCYSKEIKSAIFAGCHYIAANSLLYNDVATNDIRGEMAAPRRIAQKAKTYIPGDSIFSAAALGFGGKIANEFGESSLIFSLEDRHEIYGGKLISQSMVDSIAIGLSDGGISGLSSDEVSSYGVNHINTPPILVNPILTNYGINLGYGNGIDPYGTYAYNDRLTKNQRRSQALMVNLHAFKTDVYKSIDNQELVWTGFEILGDDLNNFIFDDNGTGVSGYKKESWNTAFPITVNVNTVPADFRTSTVQNNPLSTHWQQQYIDISNTPAYNSDWTNQGIFGGDTFICRYGFRSTMQDNSVDRSCVPKRSIHFHIVESPDNINFRHTENDSDLYFPGSIAKRILNLDGTKDLTHQDNINYDDSFSSDNDLRPAFPLPLTEIEQTEFPTRAHRSVKRDTTNLTDNYRLFLANEFKDLPKNRGELWKLSTFNNLLYFHMEESLYVTKGKQQMQMKDGTEAFVGSGDIFAQEPDEVMQADKGYGGTQSQWAASTSNYGYFFVDVNSRKVFLMKDKLSEISTAGMENWFKDNLPFELENYGDFSNCGIDNPILGSGLTSIYDPKFKRIILTKREFIPTQDFIDGWNKIGSGTAPCPTYPDGLIRFNSGECAYEVWGPLKGGGCGWQQLSFNCNNKYFDCKSWTVSYYPEFNVWCGFHDYAPYIYFNTSDNFYSVNDLTSPNTIWGHNSNIKGLFYGTVSPFEIEYIHNEYRESDTLLGSFNYTLETFNQQPIGIFDDQANISVLEQGFTSFFVYNTLQMSDEIILEYLINTRRVGSNWKVNNFRDMAALVDQTGTLGLPNTSPYYMSTNTNIVGGTNTGTITTSSIEPMFNIDGMSKTINPLYINTAKEWHQRRKFIDKWVGIRLIYSNISNNLLNLYSAEAAVRKTYK